MIDVTIEGPVATIWLNRPEKRNAVHYQGWADLEQACHRLTADPTVRIVVLRGRGPHFCAGADITDLNAVRGDDERSFYEVNQAAEQALADLSKPTIAVVQGDAVGGGCALAFDCDMRIGVRGLRMAITPGRLGIVYPAASVERLVHAVGPAVAKRMLFTADFVDGDRALRDGVIDDLWLPEEFDSKLAELLDTLGARSLLTQLAAKSMIADVMRHGSVAADTTSRWAATMAAAQDPAEGARAFAERRPAVFTWTTPADQPRVGRKP